MNIIDVKNSAVKKLFDETCLRPEYCNKIISNSFEILLFEIEKSFDEDVSRHWGSWEVTGFLHDLRMKLKRDKREIL